MGRILCLAALVALTGCDNGSEEVILENGGRLRILSLLLTDDDASVGLIKTLEVTVEQPNPTDPSVMFSRTDIHEEWNSGTGILLPYRLPPIQNFGLGITVAVVGQDAAGTNIASASLTQPALETREPMPSEACQLFVSTDLPRIELD